MQFLLAALVTWLGAVASFPAQVHASSSNSVYHDVFLAPDETARQLPLEQSIYPDKPYIVPHSLYSGGGSSSNASKPKGAPSLSHTHCRWSQRQKLPRKFMTGLDCQSGSLSEVIPHTPIALSVAVAATPYEYQATIIERTTAVVLRGGDYYYGRRNACASIFSDRLKKRNGLLVALVTLLGVEAVARITGRPSLVAATAIRQQLLSRNFWSSIAPFASIALKLSPLPSIRRWYQTGSTGGLPLLPYSAMCALTFCSMIYGWLVGDLKILGTHCAGHILAWVYCIAYMRNCGDGNRMPRESISRGGGAANMPIRSPIVDRHFKCGIVLVTGILSSVAIAGRSAAWIVGSTAAVLSSVMYTGPLLAFQQALAQKSARNIPLPYAAASLVNAIAWTVYGYYGRNKDWTVWVPSMIGLVSASLQLGVHAAYGTPDHNQRSGVVAP